MPEIVRLSVELPYYCGQPAELLVDTVAGGNSLGFVQPFSHDDACAWWESLAPALDDGCLVLWVAHDQGRVVGTVSLVLEHKPNGTHRAAVVKLMVLPSHRGRGLGRALLRVAERTAARGAACRVIHSVLGASPIGQARERGAGRCVDQAVGGTHS